MEHLQWNTSNFSTQGSKTREPIDIKLDVYDYIGASPLHTNFGVSTLKGDDCTVPLIQP